MAIPHISPNSDCVCQLYVHLMEADHFLSRQINSRNLKLNKLEQEKKSLIIKPCQKVYLLLVHTCRKVLAIHEKYPLTRKLNEKYESVQKHRLNFQIKKNKGHTLHLII